MRQLVQSVRGGDLRIVDGPDPLTGPTEVLVATSRSVVSAGTERAVRTMASANLLQKARARPDLVRQVVRKAREDGLRTTVQAVRARLEDEMPLGYSGVGRVIEVGDAVSGLTPGMRVATGGAGHADLQVVAGLLAVPVPDAVSDEQAAFATVAAIALHGLRLAEVGTGGTICVVGLGLIGQLTARLAAASGLRVYGIDLRPWTVGRLVESGAAGSVEDGDETTRNVLDWSRGRGVDAVLLTAATSSSDPVRLAPDRLRDRGRIVVVGDVGLDLQRTPLYEKEIDVRVARSYGPGRYDRAYEDWAVDYPIGHVRFTEGRNIEAVLDLMAERRLAVDDLITHSFPFERALDAYDILADSTQQYLGIQIEYEAHRAPPPTPMIRRPTTGRSIALVGAGAFARGVLVPSIAETAFGTIVAVSSATGTSAARLAAQVGAQAVAVQAAIADVAVDVVVVATSHDTHADLVIKALEGGKHVFCEKPLALTHVDLDRVRAAWSSSEVQLAVGFNRRHSPDVRRSRQVLDGVAGPIVITYRVSAGALPDAHWYHDRRMGGRLIGEVCHFVDTCNALTGARVSGVAAFGDHRRDALLANDLGVMLSYADGSVATISYASGGHPSAAKERIEVLGRGHSIVIDDFRSVTVDGETVKHRQDKGHAEQFRAFADALRHGSADHTLAAFASMSTTMDAAAALLVSDAATPDQL